MRAVLCKRYGPPETLVVEDMPSPRAGLAEVVVSVWSAAVNFPDTLIIENKYQYRPTLPFSPGSDLAGVVKEVGCDVTGFKAGDRVMALMTWGAFAEEVAVPTSALVKLPDAVAFDVAASSGLTYTTSYYALKQCGQLKKGQSLLVLGAAGGAGLAAVELGKLMGARVIACASSTEKLEVCRAAGADELVNYEVDDLRGRLKALGSTDGFDVVFDPVGGRYAEPALRSVAWEGRYLVVGFASGEVPKIALSLALMRGCGIVGVRRGQFMLRRPEESVANIEQLLTWMVNGRIKPHISGRYPLERAADAIRDLASRRVAGKLVLDVRQSPAEPRPGNASTRIPVAKARA